MVLTLALILSGGLPAQASPHEETIRRQLELIEKRCGSPAQLASRPPILPASEEYQEGFLVSAVVNAVASGSTALDLLFASKQTLCAGPNGIALACRDFTTPDWEQSENAILERLREWRDEGGLNPFQSACLAHCAVHALLSYDEGLASDIDVLSGKEGVDGEAIAAGSRAMVRSFANMGTTYVNVLEEPGGSTGQCREFAFVGRRMLSGMGHRSIAVGSIKQAHAWVLVWINGHAYALDTTKRSCSFVRHGDPKPAPRKLTPEEVRRLAEIPRAENSEDAEEGLDTVDGSYNDDLNWE